MHWPYFCASGVRDLFWLGSTRPTRMGFCTEPAHGVDGRHSHCQPGATGETSNFVNLQAFDLNRIITRIHQNNPFRTREFSFLSSTHTIHTAMDEDVDRVLNQKVGFAYPDIDAERQVRLLRISQTAVAWPLVFTLEIHDIDHLSKKEYTALSYTWGQATSLNDVCEIKVDEQPFFVRRNLWDFLCTTAALGAKCSGLFFIDAICINQLDKSERKSQVRQMARIFRNATEVVGWLGLPTDEEDFDNVRSLSKTRRENYIHWTERQRKGFRYLSYHRYWSRVWIAQEVLLARRLVILCGPFNFNPTLFQGATYDPPSWLLTKRLDEYGWPTLLNCVSARRECSPAEMIITHRTRIVLRPQVDVLAQGTRMGTLDELTGALTTTRHLRRDTYQSPVPDLYYQIVDKFGVRLQCTDPRDRLYGLLGILSRRSQTIVEPDYNKGVDFAFYQALKLGLQEIYNEMSPTVGVSHGRCLSLKDMRKRQKGDIDAFKFVGNVREAFGVSYVESMAALRKAVDELDLRNRIAADMLDLQWQQHLYWFPTELDANLKQLLVYVEREEIDGDGGGCLSRYHERQSRGMRRLIRRLSRKISSHRKPKEKFIGRSLW